MSEQNAALEQVYFMTKTFATLQLYEREAVADTLLSMLCTFVGDVVEFGVVLLFSSENTRLTAAAWNGSQSEKRALSPDAIAALEVLARDGSTRRLESGHSERAALPWSNNLAVAGLRTGDTPLGIVVLALKESADVSLDLLTAAAGIGSLALTHAQTVEEARALGVSLEKTALAAQRDAIEKSQLYAELDAKLWTIQEQAREIGSIAFPILGLSKGVVLAPIIGRIDAERGAVLADRLLAGVASSQAQILILDVTGAVVVGPATADQVVRVARAVRLLGVEVVISGVQPAVAVALGEQGLRDLGDAKTFATLAAALKHANRQMRTPT